MKRPLSALLLLTCLTGCAANSPDATLAGAWRSHIQFASGDYAAAKDMEFLYVFNRGDGRGGTMTESSNYDAAPPGPPAYGVWREVGPRRFEAFYVFFTTKPPEKPGVQGWGPAGRGELTEQINLSPDARSFDSTITLRLFNPDGKPLPGGGPATGHATRIGF